MDALHFLLFVIRPTLSALSMGGAAAERLLLGTALAESGLVFLRQHGGGPARGVYQIEPATHDDIWRNFLGSRPELRLFVESFVSLRPTSKLDQLDTDLAYATVMARLRYRRVAEPLPHHDDAVAMAAYHKQHYNTPLGKADPAKTVTWFVQAIVIHRNAEER